MPQCALQEHRLSLALPAGLKRPDDAVLVIRFTGEVFDNYEDYIKTLNFYRQRIWSCKYTGNSSLTYEEAAASEHEVDSVINCFPSAHEQAAATLVHHSLESEESLVSSIRNLDEENISVDLAASWIKTMADAQPVAGVPGVECLWKLKEYFRIKYSLPEELPSELAEKIRPARHAKNVVIPTTTNEQHAVVDTQKGAKAFDGSDNPMKEEADEDMDGEDYKGYDEDDGVSEMEDDDDYKPSRFSVDDLPWRARGRGRGRGRSAAVSRGGRGRGRRGRGRRAESMNIDNPAFKHAHPTATNDNTSHEHVLLSTMEEEGAPLVPPFDQCDNPVKIESRANELISQGMLVEESLDLLEQRMQPGSIKHGVLTLLKEAGSAGMTINELATAMIERGLKHWEEVRQARNSIASTCGHDSAFVRIAPGRFALRCMVSQSPTFVDTQALPVGIDGAQQQQNQNQDGGGGQLNQMLNTSTSTPIIHRTEAMKKIAEQQNHQKDRPRIEKNNFKCTKCHRIIHLQGSPLVLCDACPRSYHLSCIGLNYSDLPHVDDWTCPKCIEAAQVALRKVMDLEIRRKESLERAALKEKAAEEKLLKRLLTSNLKDNNNSGLAVGGTTTSNYREVRRRTSTTSQGEGGGGGQGPREGPGRPPRRILDDLVILEEEKQNLMKLQDLVQDLTRSEDGSVRLKETRQALENLQAIIDGPLKDYPRQSILSNPASTAAFYEAAIVAEFLTLYGEVCEVERNLTTSELIIAAAWPLDFASDLGPLYRQLLLCCLLEQLNKDPPVKGRSRRWFAVLTDATWPEVLRRYLLAIHVEMSDAKMKDGLTIEEYNDNEEDDNDNEEESDEKLSKKEIQPLLTALSDTPRYALDVDDDDDKAADVDPLAMDDRHFSRYCAVRLSRGAWWELPAVAHIRLLSMLCYDISQGQNLREDINTRVTECGKIQTDWTKEMTSARRKSASNHSSKNNATSRRGKNNGNHNTNDKDNAGVTSILDNDADNHNIIPTYTTARDADFQAKLDENAYRTDPLGFDRHYRRYWWLRGAPSYIFVENDDGLPAGVLSTMMEVDDLRARLNVRGPREGELLKNLNKKYKDISEVFSSANKDQGDDDEKSYDVYAVPRPIPTDGRIKQKDLPTLASMMMTDAIDDGKQQLDAFISETVDTKLELAIELKKLRKELKACENAKQLCMFLLHLERYYCGTGEGLPEGGENESIGVLIGGEDATELLDIILPPHIMTAATYQEDTPAKEDTNDKIKEENKLENDVSKEDGRKNPASTVSQGTTTDLQATTNCSGQSQLIQSRNPLDRHQVNVNVSVNDEFDCSEAEHAFLREKRMRRPARLWRSARERAVWLKTVIAAKRAAQAGSSAAGTQAAYCAHMFYDRGSKMLKIAAKLAEDTAKWEEAEAARLKAEAAMVKKAGNSEGDGPVERPLMIRTGRFKSEQGTKIILKAMGKEDFPQTRQSTADPGAPEEIIAACRWGYQCSVCMLSGDLLCCEHPEGCAVSVHPACTGLPFPQGPWICSNHTDENGNVGRHRRQRNSNAALAAAVAMENDTESEETVTDDRGGSDDDEVGEEDSDESYGRRRVRRRQS